MNWPRQDLFGDLRVRHGFKLGLAGLLALLGTQALRVPNDYWAILTVMVLLNAQFVGAFAFKATMRVAGTIVGAIVGVWLASDYASTPAIFLSLFFLVMVLAGYNFGHVGARQVPYAYFLLGLTTLAIVTDGVTNPAQAWQTGLDRTEEIVIGIISALFVSTVIWPRYAREEFIEAARATLKTTKQLVSVHAQAYLNRADATEIQALQRTFDQQLSRLRSLLQAGTRESTVLSARLVNYNAFMVSLTNFFQAGLDFSRHRGEAWFLDHVHFEMEFLFAAMSDELDMLSSAGSPGKKLPSSLMNEAFAAFETKVNQMREQGMLHQAPLQTAIDIAGELAVVRSLRDELNNLGSAMEGLPRLGQPMPDDLSDIALAKSGKPHWDFLPTIDWFWMKIAMKGGLAVVIAVVFIKWIHPPGAGNVPAMAWTLTIMGRPFLLAGGSGDLRSFQTALRASLVLAACAALLLLTTPLLASYLAMSVALFVVLFAFGFLTARIQGITYWIQVAYLTVPAFVGLNPQAPVASQTIIDTFLGLIFGIWIGFVVGRLLWPVLPQRILRDDLVALCSQIKALLDGDPHPERIRAQLANLPVEALGVIRQIRLSGCSEEERTKLVALVRSLQTLVSRVSQLISRRPVLRSGSTELAEVLGEEGNLLPESTEQILRPQFERLEIEFKQMLDAFGECFRKGDWSREFPSVRGALTEMDRATQESRDRNLLEHLPREASLRILDFVDRYHAIADTLEECGRLTSSLRIERYWGDYGL
jgi:p-hydroxybenzoic acid efflux pump subunit AaeB